jgi:putative peptidoglycan lipid II flippase
MAFGTMTSRVLGQARESLLAYYFDKHITDAWNAAFKLPNLFRRLLGEGSLSVSFIPVFVDAEIDSPERARNLVNSVYSFLLLVLGAVTAMGVLYPEPLLNLVLDPSYLANTDKYLLTLRLTKIMFGFIFFISSYAFMMGILNALGQFAWPALAPTFFNIVMILFTILPAGMFAAQGDQLALGVLIGGFIQAAILVPALMKTGYFPSLSFDYKNRDLQRIGRNMLPGLVGMGLMQFMTVINLRFASSLNEGTISYINYVDRLIELPLSLISVSLGTALLPALSGFLSRGESKKFSETARHYLELNLLMTMAAAAGLYTLAHPIVALLFGHGRFTASDVFNTAEILQAYCWIMIASSGVRVLTPAYYAVKNTWFPAAVSAFCVVVHVIVAPLLMQRFAVYGLMMSTIFSALINLSLLLIFFRVLVGEFAYFGFFKNILVFAVLAFVTGGSARIYHVLAAAMPEGIWFLVLNITLSMLTAIVVFVTAGNLFRISLVSEISQKVLRKIRR